MAGPSGAGQKLWAPLFDMDLFGMSLQDSYPAHRPFDWRWWWAFRDVKTYLKKLTGRAQWKLSAAIFFGESTYAYAQAEWARRARRFRASMRTRAW